MSFEDELLTPRQPFIDDLELWRGMLEQGSDEQLIMRLMPYHLADLRPEYEISAEMRGETVTMADFLQHCLSLSQSKPSTEEMERAPLLESWCAVSGHERFFLIGIVTAHPTLRESARTYTSLLFQAHPDHGWARTWSRYYRLGQYSKCFLWELQYEGKISGAFEILEFE